MKRAKQVDGRFIAGTGDYSHEVPVQAMHVVRMRDAQHEGTDVYWDGREFHFVPLDHFDSAASERCILARLAVLENESAFARIEAPFACDLDAPDGLVLLGIDANDKPEEWEEIAVIIWDSAKEPALEREVPLESEAAK